MTDLKALATYDDFARLDIRIGKVVDVQPFLPARNPSYKVGVDVGADRIMWSSAQITNYTPEALIDTRAACVWQSRSQEHRRFHVRASHPRREGCRRQSDRAEPP
jgi:hypothetical protein